MPSERDYQISPLVPECIVHNSKVSRELSYSPRRRPY